MDPWQQIVATILDSTEDKEMRITQPSRCHGRPGGTQLCSHIEKLSLSPKAKCPKSCEGEHACAYKRHAAALEQHKPDETRCWFDEAGQFDGSMWAKLKKD